MCETKNLLEVFREYNNEEKSLYFLYTFSIPALYLVYTSSMFRLYFICYQKIIFLPHFISILIMKNIRPFAPSPLRPFALFCLLLSAFCFQPLFAQKGKPKEPERKIVFNIKDYQDEKVLLIIHYRDKLLLKDSAQNNGKGVFVFEGDTPYDNGLYMLVSGSKKPLLNFIMDESQKFTFNLDTTGNVHHFSVINSPENAEMLRFQQKSSDAQKIMAQWTDKRKEFESKNIKDSAEYYKEKIAGLDADMKQFITELIDANPTFLFSKLQKSYRDIEIPAPPVHPDGSIDSLFQLVYYRTHYWDNFDLTDKRFLFLPSYEPKLNNYLKKVLWYQETDTINRYVDLMLQKTAPDSLMYRFLLEYLSREFETSNMIGHDGIFVHIVKNNQLAGKCTWMDEDLLKRYKMRIDDLEPMMIGKKSMEMVIPDTAQSDNYFQWISSYNMPKKYRILWFFDHTCSHCLKESKEMKIVYDSLALIGKLNFDVYAVNQTEDIEGWKKYIIKHGFTWINVGGNKGNMDWKKEYHIASNPQFYIINQDKTIILNKNITKSMIPKFLEEYEKMEAEKLKLKNKQ